MLERADDEGNLYKGIVAFMIVGLKESILYIVQTIPEVKFSGEWLADKMSNCIDDLTYLTSAEFCVRVIVTDNHASNVHFLHSLQSSILIHINTSITQEILASKRTYFMIQCIS